MLQLMWPPNNLSPGGDLLTKRASLITYTFAHFCVDFACFYVLFSRFLGASTFPPTLELIATGFLLYNVLAFGLQPFIGFLCDVRKGVPIALIGCGILFVGLVLPFPWISVILCALGNACFHVGGGIDSLVHAEGKMARSGIFVSSGAMGVALGTLAGQQGIPLVIPIALTVVSGITIYFTGGGVDKEDSEQPFNNTNPALPLSAVIVLCSVAIVIRSFVGSVIPIPWRTTTFLLLLPSIGASIGKAAGGYLADWFGARRVAVVTLLASIPLLCLAYAHPASCTVGILLFNMTMPITLCAIANKFPQHPGFAFGLTTLWLLCGSLLTFFLALPTAAAPYVMALCIAIASLCLLIATDNNERRMSLWRKRSAA